MVLKNLGSKSPGTFLSLTYGSAYFNYQLNKGKLDLLCSYIISFIVFFKSFYCKKPFFLEMEME